MKILLKEIMEEKGISIRRAELLTGVKRGTIHNIITGKTIPTLDVLEKLAKGLKVKITDLIESEYL